MATAPTPKIVTATPADIRAYFAFRAFQEGECLRLGPLSIAGVGVPELVPGLTNSEYDGVSRKRFLEIDQAMEPWRTRQNPLVTKKYNFACDVYGSQDCYADGDTKPLKEEYEIAHGACPHNHRWQDVMKIEWGTERLLADPEARETEVDINILFRGKNGGLKSQDFVSEYLDFIGAVLKDEVPVEEGDEDRDSESGRGCTYVYTVSMPLTNAPRIAGTEGLIAEMRFHGNHGLFLPEAVASE